MTKVESTSARDSLKWLAVLAAFLTGCIVWQLAAVEHSLLVTSPFRIAALIAALCLLATLMGVAVGPARWRTRLGQFLQTTLGQLQQRPTTKDSKWHWVAIVLCWAIWLAVVPENAQQQDLKSTDSAAFMRYAKQVRADGGPAALVGQLYRGEYEQANQHPLMIGLLSLFDFDHIPGQFISMAVSLLGLILMTALVAALCGTAVATVFTAILATNSTFATLSLQVTCECLLIPLVGLAWWKAESNSREDGRPSRTMISLGCLLGLIYLAKGTGPVFLAGTLAWIGWAYRRRSSGQPDWKLLIMALGAWIVVASPLLVRNVSRYGSPLYNVNSYFMFRDTFENPTQLAARMTLGEAASEFLSEKSVGELVEREVSGLAWQSLNLVRLLGPHPWARGQLFFGILLLVCAVYGFSLQGGDGRWLPVCWLVLLFPLLAWYSPIVQASERFFAPLLPALACYAAMAISRLLTFQVSAESARGSILCAVCILWTGSWNMLLWLS